MTSDLDLLEQFARENSQAAFTTLVQRHVNLVYSAARRQVRSPQLAEEIAQSVFADLARDAGKLNSETILTAWLYQVTHRTAIDVIRKESRRQLREQIAVEMQNMNATENSWTQIEPLLDDAMAALDETDRAAILLRYFENKNLREVGEQLQISDDAAQKRVSRAVEKLREFFSKRNVTIGASGLAVLISANAVQAAPIGLAATISAAAVLTGTTISTSAAVALTKTIAMTTLQKTIVAAVLTAAVGTGIFEAQQNFKLREQNQNFQQQQNSLNDQLAQLQREHDDSTNQIAGLLAENARLESGSNENELLKLRGEVGVLRTQLENAKTLIAKSNSPTFSSTNASAGGLNQALFDYLGNPISPPSNMDAAYSKEGLSRAIQNAAQAAGINLKKIEIDDSEFPFLVGVEVESANDMQKLTDEIKKLEKYNYNGNMSSSTEATMNLVPEAAYPKGIGDAAAKRGQLRLQMLFNKMQTEN